MKPKYSFVCDYASRDLNGKAMAIGIFNNINSDSFPCIHPSFYFMLGIETTPAENGQYNFKLVLSDADKVAVTPEISDVFVLNVPQKSVHVVIIGFGGIQFLHEGEYSIDFYINDSLFTSETINLIKTAKN